MRDEERGTRSEGDDGILLLRTEMVSSASTA
jgi:hypothetical protein